MADGALTYCSSSQPIYCAPPGDGLFFGGWYPGDRLIFATRSQPSYAPPVGDAVIFGCRLPDEPVETGASADGDVWLGGSAVALLVHAARADGLLNIDGAASGQAIIHAGATGDLSISGQARASVAHLLNLSGAMPLFGAARGSSAVLVAADGRIRVSGQAYFAPTWYTPRPFANQVRGRWQQGNTRNIAVTAAHRRADIKNVALTGPWGELGDIETHVSGCWEQIPKRENRAGCRWRDVRQRLQADIGTGYSHPAGKQRDALRLPWDRFQDIAGSVSAGYAHPGEKGVHRAIPWGDLDVVNRLLAAGYGHPAAKDVFKPIVSGPYWYPRWCVRRYSAPDGDRLFFDFPEAAYVFPAGNVLLFDYDSDSDPRICYDGTWNGPKDAYWYRPHEWDIPEPTTRSYYIIMNTVSLKRVADDVAIPIFGLEISSDLDSWCWSLTATLRREADLDLVRPSAGAPVEVEAVVNGNTWRFVIESYGHDRAYGSRGYSITGRSLSAYLADPYSLPVSLLQAGQLTAAQLADEALSGTGFSSDWQLDDWIVPGGVYSVANQTPMQQLLTIASAAGGTVQSALSATTISLLPWYAVLPWEWGAATVEATLPSFKTKHTSYEARTQYSGVYVSGRSQGVTCLVKRSGTDGSDQPQMRTDALITATEAGLARGKRILADSGPRSVETIAAPLFDDPGLLKPGMLIDVVDGGSTWRGMVTSCRIVAERPTVTQTINVLRYHGS